MLHVTNLPSITSSGYFCAFSGYGVTRTTRAEIRGSASARAEETQVYCKTPDDNLLPPIPTGKGQSFSSPVQWLRRGYMNTPQRCFVLITR